MDEMPDSHALGGHEAVDANGRLLGAIDAVLVDPVSRQPRWLMIGIGDAEDPKFVPTSGVVPAGESVQVSFARETIIDAPSIAEPTGMSASEERRLQDHYGLRVDPGPLPADGPIWDWP